jgi:hypothetical protein
MFGLAGYSDLPCLSNVQTSDVLKINVKMVDRLVSTCLSEIHRGRIQIVPSQTVVDSRRFSGRHPLVTRCCTTIRSIAPL